MTDELCAKCGHPRAEHSINGACYGLCGEFSAPHPAPDATEGERTAPYDCPCHDSSDCSQIDVCRAVAEVYGEPVPPHPAPDATDWKARCEAADAAIQRIGMTLGSFDEWASQGNMIADVEDRVTAAQAENEKLREATENWRAAEQARHDTITAYNAQLRDQRERGIFPPQIRSEEIAMDAAAEAEHIARKALFAALSSPPLSPEKE
jgi:hypothetical protein